MLNWLYDLFSKTSGFLFIFILIVVFVIGVFLLVKSADIFVSGASSLARKLKIPTMIIGLTIVSFGTSAPEASVSIIASLNNSSDLSIGNVIGSNICNILLVLGLPALFTPIIISKKEARNDILIMIFSILLLLVFYLFFDVDGKNAITLVEGIILFSLIILYVIYNIFQSKKSTPVENVISDVPQRKVTYVIFILLLGLLGVLIGGDLVTYSAKNIALKIGISEVLIGLTIVAICTSLPELVTTLVAARKGENDIAIGNVVGSNIFNVLFILGATSIIGVQYFSSVVVIDIIIALCLSVFVFLLYIFKVQIRKNIGIIMIITYTVYVTYLILRDIL